MKSFKKTALVVLLTVFTAIACTNQDVVEDMNYKDKDIQEVEVVRLVEEQLPNNGEENTDLPTAKRDPIIKIKRDRD